MYCNLADRLQSQLSEQDIKLCEQDIKLSEQYIKLCEQDIKLSEQDIKLFAMVTHFKNKYRAGLVRW